jgi:hypothetical protein
MRWLIAVMMLTLCSCNLPGQAEIDQSRTAAGLSADENAWMAKSKEDAVKKATGTDAITAPCEAYEQTVPGIPIWPGVRLGGLSTKKNIILPPVDMEEEFNRRMMKHRIEQRVFWSNRLNKGIMFGFIVMVVGLVVKLWAKLDVGARIAVFGFAFSCLCVVCQWYFDYIPYISLGFVGCIALYIGWDIYDSRSSKKTKDELADTVETVKDKIRSVDLGHIWDGVKGELEHSKSTVKHIEDFKKRMEKAKA